jgi:hypothetical protein
VRLSVVIGGLPAGKVTDLNENRTHEKACRVGKIVDPEGAICPGTFPFHGFIVWSNDAEMSTALDTVQCCLSVPEYLVKGNNPSEIVFVELVTVC